MRYDKLVHHETAILERKRDEAFLTFCVSITRVSLCPTLYDRAMVCGADQLLIAK